MSDILQEVIDDESEDDEIENECCEDGYIENFSIWNETKAGISLWKYIDDDSFTGYLYRVVLNYYLDDDPLRVISVVTKVILEDALFAIRLGADSISMLYDEISDVVCVFDGESLEWLYDEKYTITEAFDDLIEE